METPSNSVRSHTFNRVARSLEDAHYCRLEKRDRDANNADVYLPCLEQQMTFTGPSVEFYLQHVHLYTLF